jgi:hypothetical protein
MITGTEQYETGACCTNCMFTAFDTPCRAAVGTCDAEEVCDGLSETCPADAALPEDSQRLRRPVRERRVVRRRPDVRAALHPPIGGGRRLGACLREPVVRRGLAVDVTVIGQRKASALTVRATFGTQRLLYGAIAKW